MTAELYKVLHLVGIACVLVALGGSCLIAMRGKGDTPEQAKIQRIASAAMHGIGLLIVLISGFGMLARYGHDFSPWVHAKLGLWLLLGVAVVIPKRLPQASTVLYVLLPVLTGVAAYLAIMKPF